MVNFTVTVFKAPNYGTQSIITSDVLSIPLFTETGDGELNTAVLRLDGAGGKYMTGATKIEDHDRILIVVTDGVVVYSRSFEVGSRVPIENKLEPPTVQLELIGIEVYLQRVKCSMNTFRMSTRTLFTNLMDCYNISRTDNMPTISYDVTDIPDIISNLDWSSEDSILNRLNELVDSFGAAGESNGVNEYYDIRFSTNTLTGIGVNIFISGNPDTTGYTTIQNPISLEGRVDASPVSMVGSWGDNNSGSLPTSWSRFSARQMLMPTHVGSDSLFPQWVSGFNYPLNSMVRYKGSLDRIYKRITTNINNLGIPPENNATDWDMHIPSEYYGNIQYSPWTIQKARHWKSSGAGFVGSPFADGAITNNPNGYCFFDGNLIINDSSDENPAFRTWVDLISSDRVAHISKFKYGGTTLANGTRMLATTSSSGTPESTYTIGNIYEWNNGAWEIKYTPKTDMIVAVLLNAKVYRYTGGSWQLYTVGNAHDCFHPYLEVLNTTGPIIDPVWIEDNNQPKYFTNNTNSAITVKYSWLASSQWLLDTLSDALQTNRGFYTSGAWLSFRLPFPAFKSSASDLNYSEQIGELYGGSTTTALVPELDTSNITYTHDGKIGYTHNTSEDLGQLQSIDFFMKLKYLISNNIESPTGNYPMLCFLIDRNDHVAVSEFVISFNNEWQAISLPFSGFSLYKGRRPKEINPLANVVPLKDLSYHEVFEEDHIKMICFSTKDSYDEFGRYSPATNNFGGGFFAGKTQQIELSIDALRFSKPLLTITTLTSGDPVKHGEFLQKPTIFNYEQLKTDAYVELQKLKFPYVEYNITTIGNGLIDYGDYFYLQDQMVSHSDNNNTPNTVRLVAKHIEFSITKPMNGLGGFVRKIRGVRRYPA